MKYEGGVYNKLLKCFLLNLYPIPSMYGISTYIYHKFLTKCRFLYTSPHGSYGYESLFGVFFPKVWMAIPCVLGESDWTKMLLGCMKNLGFVEGDITT